MRVIIVVIDIKLPNGTITQKSFHFPAEKKVIGRASAPGTKR
jgi:hypothetical protein